MLPRKEREHVLLYCNGTRTLPKSRKECFDCDISCFHLGHKVKIVVAQNNGKGLENRKKKKILANSTLQEQFNQNLTRTIFPSRKLLHQNATWTGRNTNNLPTTP